MKPASQFPANREHRDGLSSLCRACHTAAKRRWLARNPERAEAYKAAYNAARRVDPYPPRRCRTCGQEFTPVRGDQNYCRRWCREHRYLAGTEGSR
jgi:hypothetical protein